MPDIYVRMLANHAENRPIDGVDDWNDVFYNNYFCKGKLTDEGYYAVASPLNAMLNTQLTTQYYGYLVIKKGENETFEYQVKDLLTGGEYFGSGQELTVGMANAEGGTIQATQLGVIPSAPQDVKLTTYGMQIPVFDVEDEEAIENYVQNGDDSGALNYNELHGTRVDIYATNNGQRISFKVHPQDTEKNIYLFDYAEVKMYDKFVAPIPSVIGEYTFDTGGLDTDWDELLIKKISSIIVITKLYYKNQKVAEFKTNLTRKLLGLGSVSCDPMNDISSGYEIHWATDNAFDDITTPSDDGSDASDNPNDGSQFTGFSNLCQTYKVTKQALADLGNYLWNQSIFNDIKLLNNSPLENIVSCHYMPCSIGGSNHKIAFGNLDTNVSGQLLNQNMIKVNVASFNVPLYNTGFLGLSPYTSISLYLPFVGMVDLDPKDVCGHGVSIDYVFDVVVGSFGVMVYTSKGGGKTLIYSSQGTCSVDVPLTASNKAQVQASILQSGVSLVSNAVTGDAMGIVGDVGRIASVQNHSSTFGSPSSMVGALSPTTCYYIVRTPITNLPSNFAHTKGYMCMQTYKLSELKGFTRLSSDIDLSGFALTQNELNRLKSILTTGFYL